MTVSLTAAETEALLHRAAAAYGTHDHDLLLSALVKAAEPWIGRDDMLVDVEDHGRDDVFNDVDISQDDRLVYDDLSGAISRLATGRRAR